MTDLIISAGCAATSPPCPPPHTIVSLAACCFAKAGGQVTALTQGRKLGTLLSHLQIGWKLVTLSSRRDNWAFIPSCHLMGSCRTTSRKVRPAPAPPASAFVDDSLAPSSRSCCSSFSDRLRPVPADVDFWGVRLQEAPFEGCRSRLA